MERNGWKENQASLEGSEYLYDEVEQLLQEKPALILPSYDIIESAAKMKEGDYNQEDRSSQSSYWEENQFSQELVHPEVLLPCTTEKQDRMIRKNLHYLILNLIESSDSRNEFLIAFPKWEGYRICNIKLLDHLANKLDKCHEACNIAKTAGSVLGIIGSILGIVGAIVNPAKSHTVDGFELASVVGSVTSNVTYEIASCVEVGISSDVLGKVKALIQKDFQQFQIIINWHGNCKTLTTAAQRVCDFNIMETVFGALLSRIPEIVSFAKEIEEVANEVVAEVCGLTKKRVSSKSSKKIILLCEAMRQNTNVIASVRKVHELLKESPFSLSVGIISFKMFFDFRRISNCKHTSKKVRRISGNKRMSYAVFEAIKIASDVVALLHLAKDFKEGSVSEYSGVIRNVKHELEEELRVLKDIKHIL